MRNSIFQRGLVLDAKVIREADLCLTILGEDSGKVLAIARSARRSKKRFFGGVDLFDYGTFELTPPARQSQWYTLAGVSERHQWQTIQRDLTSFSLAAFCLELTRELAAEGDAEGGAFLAPLVRTLNAIEKNSAPNTRKAITAHYVLVLHRMSGFEAADISSDAQISAWFGAMRDQQKPIVPHQSTVLDVGFRELITYSQQIVERPLKTAFELLRAT